ncbi:MAG: PHP domain-containing protein [Firmicutes bacterium]|nr:PHP domain-containing protein [Bacillota bacterium]
MHGRADLHCHTTASDGTFTPEQLVQEAARRGLAAIAVTDHDSVDGVEASLDAGDSLGVTVVGGVEISTDVDDGEIHVLGYFVDVHHEPFLKLLYEQRESRLRRVELMLEKLARLGVNLEISDVLAVAEPGASVGRPHVASAMIRGGYVTSWDEAFSRYIGRRAPAYVPRSKLTPHEAVQAILEAGGVPVMAHPGLVNNDHMIPSLVESGLKGIEVVYPDHSPAQQRHYQALARQYGLVATGGSDCHGPRSKSGVMLGTSTVDVSVVEELRRQAVQ